MKSILLGRFILLFIIFAYDFANHEDFHERYINEDSRLSNSLLVDNLHSSRYKSYSLIDPFSQDNFQLKVLDQFISRVSQSTGESINYFVVEVLFERKNINTVEKSYKDFKAFEVAMEYALRGTGIKAPKLATAESILDKLGPSNDVLFR